MKRSLTRYCLIAFIALAITGMMQSTFAQPVKSADAAKSLVEKTLLITDRDIYCADEELFFSAFNISSEELRNSGWSNVLYVELISPDGQVIAQKKITYGQDGANGFLKIPVSTLTGNYYLRAYTRWMRDFSPSNYFYKMVTVINPFRPELLEPSGETEKAIAKMYTPEINNTVYNLELNKNTFHKREQVNLEIKIPEAESLTGQYTVSVIPSGSGSLKSPELSGLKNLTFMPYFIPETRGLSISGKVVNAADSIPIPYTLVGLTVFKENPEIRNVRSNENGQFFFDLSQLKGDFEIFISAKSEGPKSPLILVDNDFSTTKIDLPFVPVDFSVESKKLYQSISFNSQMQALYQQAKVEEQLKLSKSDSSFYITPDFVLKLNDYVMLPSIREYFYELIPQVRVKHEGKKTALKVLGNYSELSIYDPLVLVDMVPIFDIDKVLDLQPEKLDRFEVVTTPYVRGDIVFGGIVSLISKKGDMAGIDLPTAGRFITYAMINCEQKQAFPVVTSQRVPDLRNCLYWNPALVTAKNGSVKVSFGTGDNTGNFLIVVKGIGKDGLLKVATKEILIQ